MERTKQLVEQVLEGDLLTLLVLRDHLLEEREGYKSDQVDFYIGTLIEILKNPQVKPGETRTQRIRFDLSKFAKEMHEELRRLFWRDLYLDAITLLGKVQEVIN